MNWLFEKISIIGRPLATDKKTEKTEITTIRNEIGCYLQTYSRHQNDIEGII